MMEEARASGSDPLAIPATREPPPTPILRLAPAEERGRRPPPPPKGPKRWVR